MMIEYLKVLLSWPVVALVFLVVFHDRLKNLIDRTKSVGFGNTIAEFQEQNQKSMGSNVIVEAKNISDPAITKSEDKDKLELKKNLFFEKIYYIIFRTQINFLKALRNVPEKGLSISSFKTDFLPLLAKPGTLVAYPDFDYMAYLEKSGLIKYLDSAKEKGAMVSITPLGIDFLAYLDKNHYTGLEKSL